MAWKTLFGLCSIKKKHLLLVCRIQTWSHVGFWWATSRCYEIGYHGGKRDKKPRSRIGRPSIEGARDCWDSRHLKKPRGSYLACNFGMRKRSARWLPRLLISDNKHQLTPPPSPRPNWTNWASNCFPIHRILQIWPPATTGFLETSKRCSVVRDFAQMMK